jgi:hypothetical protein
MNKERTYLLAMIAVALLASIPQIPVDMKVWGLILVLVGLVGGVMLKYDDVVQRLLIYVVAVTLPMFADSLDYIPAVGSWVNGLLDNMAIGVQGLAVGVFAMGLMARIRA